MATTKKNVGNIDMSFTAEEKKPEEIKKASETFEKEGHVIYKKDETGFMQFFDADNNPVGDDVIEKLSGAYPAIPETSDNGDEKDGELKTRYVKHEIKDGVTKNIETDIADCEIIEYRQYYKNGEAVIQTIPKKHYYIVKYLKGEYD